MEMRGVTAVFRAERRGDRRYEITSANAQTNNRKGPQLRPSFECALSGGYRAARPRSIIAADS